MRESANAQIQASAWVIRAREEVKTTTRNDHNQEAETMRIEDYPITWEEAPPAPYVLMISTEEEPGRVRVHAEGCNGSDMLHALIYNLGAIAEAQGASEEQANENVKALLFQYGTRLQAQGRLGPSLQLDRVPFDQEAWASYEPQVPRSVSRCMVVPSQEDTAHRLGGRMANFAAVYAATYAILEDPQAFGAEENGTIDVVVDVLGDARCSDMPDHVRGFIQEHTKPQRVKGPKLEHQPPRATTRKPAPPKPQGYDPQAN